MGEEHAEYNILLTVQRHTFDDFDRKIYSLWHNSLIRISTFREFRSQQFHEGHNLFANCRWKHGGESLFTRFSVL